MFIRYGLMSGAVLQRHGEECDTLFCVEATSLPVSSLGRLTVVGEEDGALLLRLSGIFTGGPYTLTLSDEEGSLTLTDLYVGDVWMLGGQSNMEGVAYIPDAAPLFQLQSYLRSFSLTETEWKPAHPNSHPNNLSPHPFVNRIVPPQPTKFKIRSIGPGFFFAEAMYRRTGVPQGLIPCALGGASMTDWDPDPIGEEDNLYRIALHRIKLSGGRIRGIFWYQGCAEANPEAAEAFLDRMKRMVASFRRDLSEPALPFVQVQIYRYFSAPAADDALWSRIRELQRTMDEQIPYLDTVSTVGYGMSDDIHLDALSQQKLGIQSAESMYRLCFDPCGVFSCLAPKLHSVFFCKYPDRACNTLAVRFTNLHGSLIANGMPWGFSLSTRPDLVDLRGIFRVDLRDDTAYIRHEIPNEQIENCYLSYLFGNGVIGNITDSEGRPIPAFGPIKIKDLM